MVNSYKKTAFAAALAGCFVAGAADASHFRGGALVPEVDASGLLTITATTFWRPTSNGRLGNINIGGAGTSGSFTRDTTDSRFDRVVETYTRQLAGAGTTVISDSSCCRVQGIRNGVSSNTSVNFSLSSTIVWDGVNANTPILFDFAGVQNEVVRGANYSQNLNALSGSGHTLTYDAALNDTRFNQPPGFAINAATGEMTIPSINTATFLDNASGNTGADYYFSGTIKSSDGSLVTLDWLFDSVG
ncbi:MAG: hypothetical protein K0U93_08915, partial [Gammaproteobacteria bacterium]|nr:hypothetical protein [Gammaproteobacteria bacterium]